MEVGEVRKGWVEVIGRREEMRKKGEGSKGK